MATMVAGTAEAVSASWVAAIVLLPLVGFLLNGAAAIGTGQRARRGEAPDFRHWTYRLPSWVGPGVVAAAFVLAVLQAVRYARADLHGPVILRYFAWMPVGELRVEAAALIDPLSLLMTLVVTGVGALIHVFSIGYMGHDPGYPRYMAYLNLFVFFMLVLVLGASFPVLFVGWEGVGLCSYLLIGFWFTEKANADAGRKAFVVNRIGDVGFLVGMALLFAHLGTLDFVEVAQRAPQIFAVGAPAITAIALFLFLGATGKSAQIPLYVWLPDAMAGPTPVSALIHAATMVTAGVYMIARNATLYTLAPAASLVVALVGALTAFFAATIGTKQWDIKRVLAYSTVSQLGFMVAAVGMGAYVAGMFHLTTHAFFKAALFLGSGAVIHAMHEALHAVHRHEDAQDMRNMGGLRRAMPVTVAVMLVATLAIAGIPPFAGFFSKDEIVGAAWLGAHGELPLSRGELFGVPGRVWLGFIWGTLSLASLLTAFYMGRLLLYTFFGRNRLGLEPHLHEVGPSMRWPLAVLGGLSVVGGLLNVEPEVPVVGWFRALAIGGPAALHHWLAPVFAPAQALTAPVPEAHPTAVPVVLAVAIGIVGLALAFGLLRPDGLRPAAEAPEERGLARVLYRTWFVDEIYDALVVRPVVALARLGDRLIDNRLIDGLVDGSARFAQGLGLLVGRLQSGQVNTYAFVLTAGALLVLVGMALGFLQG